jgi:hypothetical protein
MRKHHGFLVAFLCMCLAVGVVTTTSNAQEIPTPLGGPKTDSSCANGVNGNGQCKAEASNIAGVWTGILSQGGNTFGARLDLEQAGETISGSSSLEIEQRSDRIFVRISVTGTVVNPLVTLQEGVVQKSSPGSSWCIKTLRLKLNTDGSLSGPWNAPNCVPGTITLTRAVGAH